MTKQTKEYNAKDDWEKEEWGGWKFVSDMLDTPDKNGIYHTSECYKKLYDFVVAQKEKAKEKSYQQGFTDGADSTGRVAQEVMAIKIKEIEGLVNEIGTGAFSTDHLEHANNTIEHAKEIAQKVLSILKEKR